MAPKIANFHIVIVSSDNLKLSFDWRLQKVEEGDFIGSLDDNKRVAPLNAPLCRFKAFNET